MPPLFQSKDRVTFIPELDTCFPALIDDTDDDEANTNLGKKFKAAPWGMFKVVITLIFGAIAVTQLLEVW